MMRRFLSYLGYAAAALVLIAAAVWGAGYLWSLRQTVDPASLPGIAAWEPESKLALGADGKAVLKLELPLWCGIRKSSVEPGAGLVQSGPVVLRSRWRWNKKLWSISVPFRAYRLGNIPPGSLSLVFSSRKSKEPPVTFQAVIPDCIVTDSGIPQGDELALAGEVSPARRSLSPHWLWLLLLLPVIWLAGRFFRRSKNAPPPPPWVTAKLALEALLLSLQKGETRPELGFFRLTDLVRNYLELRFHIPASTRTTPEFLSAMEGFDAPSPLPEEQRPFLREFLQAADLVKFAKAPPDRAMLEQAIRRAEELVERTKPVDPQEEKEKKNV